ncbi:helix-turn-helix transcriptional regulator [Streptomyces odontomachi]|uniref:helix-turn-helix transcriptional regulator n=1 Tax=Streptomyces odontomachi TaxID=2944940 RepID=UPI00210A4221|nr:helix-turn-helix transcriptional regulator [Streptomyces sp. ODS25]
MSSTAEKQAAREATAVPSPEATEESAPARGGTPKEGFGPARRPPPAESEIRRTELARFLRSRRERIAPEQVGLPRGSRRRTPGLRREEVAQLAAVGVTWYTWLEQARGIQVSAQVLDSLARTLMMDAAERAHLFTLAGAVDPAPGTSSAPITPAVRLLLAQLEPIPAAIQNARYDILAHNRTFGRLFCDLDALPPEDRNCLLLCFTHPQWRASLVSLDETARWMAAKFRTAMADHLAEPAWKTLLGRLKRESAEFREVWERHEVVAMRARKRKQFRNADVGLLDVDHTDLWLGPVNGPRLVSYTPVDERTRERMEKLQELAAAGE